MCYYIDLTYCRCSQRSLIARLNSRKEKCSCENAIVESIKLDSCSKCVQEKYKQDSEIETYNKQIYCCEFVKNAQPNSFITSDVISMGDYDFYICKDCFNIILSLISAYKKKEGTEK